MFLKKLSSCDEVVNTGFPKDSLLKPRHIVFLIFKSLERNNKQKWFLNTLLSAR
jgi:hypothetical protein